MAALLISWMCHEPPPKVADLVIASFFLNPSSPEVGGTTTANITVRNQGNDQAETFVVQWKPHENYSGLTQNVPGLPPNEFRTLSFNFVYNDRGTFTTSAEADITNTVNEGINENNNSSSRNITVRGITEHSIVPDPTRTGTQDFSKESHHKFECPLNTVLIGRGHRGDENGPTTYKYAALLIIQRPDLQMTTTDHQWSNWFKESSGQWFRASNGRVLTGREHEGDENGQTRYQTAVVKVSGEVAAVKNKQESSKIKESSGNFFECPQGSVMTGRWHDGDENGSTKYEYGSLFVELFGVSAADTLEQFIKQLEAEARELRAIDKQ